MNNQYAFAGFTCDFRDFRGSSWGMSKEEVKFSEDLAPMNEGAGYIAYRDRVMGLDAVVGFHFLDNSLTEAGYAFREPLGGLRTYLRNYLNVKKLLADAYGNPAFDENTCAECGGFCVRCSGEECADSCPVVYLCEWTTSRSVIRLVLMGDGGRCDFGLLHRSMEHELRVGMGRTGPG